MRRRLPVMPREIVTFQPPGGEFRKADYPWLRAVRACVRGGDGGASSDGTPGERGETRIELIHDDEIPPVLRIEVGRGGRGAPGAASGQDAFILLELYDEPVPE